MKVLVTGSGGFIARHLIKRLLREGYEVVGVDDYSNSAPDFDWESEFEFHKQDISKLNPGHHLFDGVKCIFHLAAKARVQPSFEDPKKYFDTNVTGTLNLLEACRYWKIDKFVFSSSSSVYGGMNLSTTQEITWGGLKEDRDLSPESPYALSKVHGEDLCNFYKKKFGISCTILRYFNVYGDNQPSSGQYPQMLPYFIHLYKSGKPFTIYGDGKQRRDFTYVEDVVDANIQVMLSTEIAIKMGFSIVYNIGSNTNYSVNEVCDLIDPNHPKIFLEKRLEPPVTLADNNKAKVSLAWKPTMTVEQWIRNQKL